MTKTHLCGYRQYEHPWRAYRWLCWFCAYLAEFSRTHVDGGASGGRAVITSPLLKIIHRGTVHAWRASKEPTWKEIRVRPEPEKT